MEHQFSVAQIKDMIQSMCDPLHFMSNHVKVNGETLLISEEMKEWAYSATNWKVSELGDERASGRTTFLTAYILWYAIFHENKTIFLVAPRNEMSKMNRTKIQDMYDQIPAWLRPAIVENNAQCMRFANGARIIFTAAGENTGRGYTINLLAFDEWDLISERIKDSLFHNLAPCLGNFNQVITTGDGTEWGVFNKPLDTPLTRALT